MRFASLLPLSALLLVGCFDATPASTDVPATDTTPDAGSVADAPRPDAPVLVDVPAIDAPVVVDVPTMDASTIDAPAVDAPTVDAPTVDAPTVDAPAQDASVEDDASTKCIGRPSSCATGTPGGACGDTLTPPVCESGAWRCPAGTIPVTECACAGRPPGPSCVCASGGWVCSDAGA